MAKLLIATHNPGKIREYKELLAGLPLELTYPAQEGLDIEVAETGKSFAENAILKAGSYARYRANPYDAVNFRQNVKLLFSGEWCVDVYNAQPRPVGLEVTVGGTVHHSRVSLKPGKNTIRLKTSQLVRDSYRPS